MTRIRTLGLVGILSTCCISSHAQLLPQRFIATYEPQTASQIVQTYHAQEKGEQLLPIFAPRKDTDNACQGNADSASQELYHLDARQHLLEDARTSVIETTQAHQKLKLDVEPLPPQFDSPSQAYRSAAMRLLPFNSIAAVSVIRPFGNMNGDPKKAYGFETVIHGFGGEIKGQYRLSSLNNVIIQGSINDRGEKMLRAPISQFKIPFLPHTAHTDGGLNYKIGDKHPSISIISRW